MAVNRLRLFQLYKAAVSSHGNFRFFSRGAALNATLPSYKEKDDHTVKSPKTEEPSGLPVINEPTERKHPEIDLSFSDAENAYKSKSTTELARALLVFNLCSINLLADHHKTIFKWAKTVLSKRLFAALMQQTFYGHFVAGPDQESIKSVVTNNRKFGVKSILDYSAERDLSPDDAVTAEMSSCVPDNMYPHETAVSVQYQAHRLFGDRRDKVTSARTYFYEDEKRCDENMKAFLGCIDAVADATEKSGFAAVKLTALGKPQLLIQMSDILNTVKNYFIHCRGLQAGEHDVGGKRFRLEDFDKHLTNMGVSLKDGGSRKRVSIMDITSHQEVDLLDWHNLLEINRSLYKLWLIPDLKTGKLRPLVHNMSEKDEEKMKNVLRRINTLVEYAAEREVRIMVDAEQSYFQPAISRLTMEMMRKFNKQSPIVFNTYQCYLKQVYDDLVVDLDLAGHEDFCFGAKLVRGAYMDQERERALVVGYEDPVHATAGETTEMYHSVIKELMRQINLRERGKIAVMVGTHNEETICKTIELMKLYNIGPQDNLVSFAQLLGMSDNVSFPLGQAGYSVYKYVPYGSPDEVLPYLARRAKENRGVLEKVKKEKGLLHDELMRRIKSGQIVYNPASKIASPPPKED